MRVTVQEVPEGSPPSGKEIAYVGFGPEATNSTTTRTAAPFTEKEPGAAAYPERVDEAE